MRHRAAMRIPLRQLRTLLTAPHFAHGAGIAKRLLAFALLSVASGTACGGGASDGAPTAPAATAPAPSTMSAVASSHLNEILAIMQGNSINRLTINWSAFRGSVLAYTPTAQTIAQTYPAITQALRLLGDGHSSYTSSSGTLLFVLTRSCSFVAVTTPTLPSTIGYVRVSAFSGTSAQALAFANSIQTTIRNADRAGLIGWIVDLRGNGGGNMWPMIAGLGPILGDGILGYFIDPEGATSSWSYHDGASWNDSYLIQSVDQPYQLRLQRPKVAVLTDIAVASSGEATTIAFRQRPDTRSFGGATCGASTANRAFTLGDGARLNLTVSVMADRTRAKYGDVIVPDEVYSDGATAVQRAVAWLQGAVR